MMKKLIAVLALLTLGACSEKKEVATIDPRSVKMPDVSTALDCSQGEVHDSITAEITGGLTTKSDAVEFAKTLYPVLGGKTGVMVESPEEPGLFVRLVDGKTKARIVVHQNEDGYAPGSLSYCGELTQ